MPDLREPATVAAPFLGESFVVEAFETRGDTAEVGGSTLLAVADHADARMNLIVQRKARGVILRGFQRVTLEHPVRTLVMDLFIFGVQWRLLSQPCRLRR